MGRTKDRGRPRGATGKARNNTVQVRVDDGEQEAPQGGAARRPRRAQEVHVEGLTCVGQNISVCTTDQ